MRHGILTLVGVWWTSNPFTPTFSVNQRYVSSARRSFGGRDDQKTIPIAASNAGGNEPRFSGNRGLHAKGRLGARRYSAMMPAGKPRYLGYRLTLTHPPLRQPLFRSLVHWVLPTTAMGSPSKPAAHVPYGVPGGATQCRQTGREPKPRLCRDGPHRGRYPHRK